MLLFIRFSTADSRFKHYRELTTEDQAEQWFAIAPKPDQWANTYVYDYKARTVTLPVNEM